MIEEEKINQFQRDGAVLTSVIHFVYCYIWVDQNDANLSGSVFFTKLSELETVS